METKSPIVGTSIPSPETVGDHPFEQMIPIPCIKQSYDVRYGPMYKLLWHPVSSTIGSGVCFMWGIGIAAENCFWKSGEIHEIPRSQILAKERTFLYTGPLTRYREYYSRGGNNLMGYTIHNTAEVIQ